jgi:hypothetical protein
MTRKSTKLVAAAAILSAAVSAGIVGGCHSEPAEPSQSTKEGNGAMKNPTGMERPQPTGSSGATVKPTESTKEGSGAMKTPAGMAKPAPEPALKASDLTHVVTTDTPYYKSSPAQGRPADGTFKGGTKVLLLMPMGSYSQVQAESGAKGYVATESLKPIN